MSIKHYEPFLITMFRFGDGMIAGVTSYIALTLFNDGGAKPFATSLIVALITMIVFTYNGVYRSWRVSSLKDEVRRLSKSCLLTYLLYFPILYWLYPAGTHEGWRIASWMVFWPLFLFSERLVVRLGLRYLRKKGHNIKTAVIAGTGSISQKLVRWIDENPWSGTRVIGFFDGTEKNEIGGYPVLGYYSKLPEYVKKHNIDIVYIAMPGSHTNKAKLLMEKLKDTTTAVKIIPDVFSYDYIRGSYVQYMEGMPVISVSDSPVRGINFVLKRLEDIVFALFFIIVLSPLMFAIVIAIKVSMGSPVLFKQWRYGLDGRHIQIWKFRTMNVYEDGYGINEKEKNDPRITKIGRILRRLSFDELPQFFNVLTGKLSIVGPRPHAISEVEKYRKLINGSMLRHKVKPGITGLAQLYGTRGVVDSDEKLQKRIGYDLEYLNRWSIWLDLKIIAQTAIHIFDFRKDAF